VPFPVVLPSMQKKLLAESIRMINAADAGDAIERTIPKTTSHKPWSEGVFRCTGESSGWRRQGTQVAVCRRKAGFQNKG
jgi:hypothetical protein